MDNNINGHSYFTTYDEIAKMAKLLRSKIRHNPEIGIVCGSGLGKICHCVEDADVVDYSEIPGLPVSTVRGHKGNFVVGKLSGKSVIAMQGRIHTYEGYSANQCTIPLRLMYMLGVKTILLTNAAGSLNENYAPGDIVLIKDHLNMPGFAGHGPLVGPHDDRFGPRFVHMKNAYDKGLRALAVSAADEKGFKLRQGVYAMMGGPQYECPSEALAMKRLGADLVGMSTANEAIVARQCGLKVVAFSLVTNNVNVDCELVDQSEDDIHADVLKIGNQKSSEMISFVSHLIRKL